MDVPGIISVYLSPVHYVTSYELVPSILISSAITPASDKLFPGFPSLLTLFSLSISPSLSFCIQVMAIFRQGNILLIFQVPLRRSWGISTTRQSTLPHCHLTTSQSGSWARILTDLIEFNICVS